MDLTPSQKDILIDLQQNGDNTPGNIADNIDVTRHYVSQVMPDLEDKGLVRNKGRGVWTLTEQGEDLVENELLDR